MEAIPKRFKDEIDFMQSRLLEKISCHHECLKKMKEHPSNTRLPFQLHEIQEDIISISHWQKDIIRRLEIEKGLKANGFITDGSAVLDNNNVVKKESKRKQVQVIIKPKSSNVFAETTQNMEEESVGSVESPEKISASQESNSSNEELQSNSAEAVQFEEEVEEKLPIEQAMESIVSLTHDPKDQANFLLCLGLIPPEKVAEMTSRRRTKRNCAPAKNPMYEWGTTTATKRKRKEDRTEVPTKPPKTRQSTLKSNGPSPPPKSGYNKSTKSLSNNSKVTTQVPKICAKPKVLNVLKDSKGILGNNKTNKQKSIKESPNLESLNVPKLPTGLTIERIENESVVCITCKNPGFLNVCESCSANFHSTCHKTLPGSKWNCPKCVELGRIKNTLTVINRNDDSIAATIASRFAGQSGGNTIIHSSLQKPKRFKRTKSDLQKMYSQLVDVPAETSIIPINKSPNNNFVSYKYQASKLEHPSSSSNKSYPTLLNHLKQPQFTKISATLSQKDKASKNIFVEEFKTASKNNEKVNWNASRGLKVDSSSQGLTAVLNYKWPPVGTDNRIAVRNSLSILKPMSERSFKDSSSNNSNDCIYLSSSSSSGTPEIIELERPVNKKIDLSMKPVRPPIEFFKSKRSSEGVKNKSTVPLLLSGKKGDVAQASKESHKALNPENNIGMNLLRAHLLKDKKDEVENTKKKEDELLKMTEDEEKVEVHTSEEDDILGNKVEENDLDIVEIAQAPQLVQLQNFIDRFSKAQDGQNENAPSESTNLFKPNDYENSGSLNVVGEITSASFTEIQEELQLKPSFSESEISLVC